MNLSLNHVGVTSSRSPLELSKIREIEEAGLKAGLPLMQRAGQALAKFVLTVVKPKDNILILAGPGNNGGDALVATSALQKSGYAVNVWMPVTTDLPKDAEHALQSWLDEGGQVGDQLPESKPALVIDGLFGIGLNRQMGSPWQEAIDVVNKWHVPVLAVDIPSGLEADTGRHLGRPIRATWTMSLIAPTLAVFSQSGKAFAGDVLVERLVLDL